MSINKKEYSINKNLLYCPSTVTNPIFVYGQIILKGRKALEYDNIPFKKVSFILVHHGGEGNQDFSVFSSLVNIVFKIWASIYGLVMLSTQVPVRFP